MTSMRRRPATVAATGSHEAAPQTSLGMSVSAQGKKREMGGRDSNNIISRSQAAHNIAEPDRYTAAAPVRGRSAPALQSIRAASIPAIPDRAIQPAAALSIREPNPNSAFWRGDQ